MKLKHLLGVIGLLIFVTVLARERARIEFVTDDSAKAAKGPPAGHKNTFKARNGGQTQNHAYNHNIYNLDKPLFTLELKELQTLTKDDEGRGKEMDLSGQIIIKPKWFMNAKPSDSVGIKKYKFTGIKGPTVEFENGIACRATTPYYNSKKAQITIKVKDKDAKQKKKDPVDIHPAMALNGLHLLIDAKSKEVFLGVKGKTPKKLGGFNKPITVRGNVKVKRTNVEAASLTFVIKSPAPRNGLKLR